MGGVEILSVFGVLYIRLITWECLLDKTASTGLENSGSLLRYNNIHARVSPTTVNAPRELALSIRVIYATHVPHRLFTLLAYHT